MKSKKIKNKKIILINSILEENLNFLKTTQERSRFLGTRLENDLVHTIQKSISPASLRINSTNPVFHMYTSDSIELPDCVGKLIKRNY